MKHAAIIMLLIVYARLGYMFSNYFDNYGINHEIGYFDVFGLTGMGCMSLAFIGFVTFAIGALIYGACQAVQGIIQHYNYTMKHYNQLTAKKVDAKLHSN